MLFSARSVRLPSACNSRSAGSQPRVRLKRQRGQVACSHDDLLKVERDIADSAAAYLPVFVAWKLSREQVGRLNHDSGKGGLDHVHSG